MDQPNLPKSKDELSNEELRVSFNNETGKLTWDELAPHFARGVVVVVNTGVDLIDVAVKFARDDRDAVEKLLTSGDVAKANDDHARGWHQSKANFWAVVSAPFVLVQEIADEDQPTTTH